MGSRRRTNSARCLASQQVNIVQRRTPVGLAAAPRAFCYNPRRFYRLTLKSWLLAPCEWRTGGFFIGLLPRASRWRAQRTLTPDASSRTLVRQGSTLLPYG